MVHGSHRDGYSASEQPVDTQRMNARSRLREVTKIESKASLLVVKLA